MIPVRTLRCYLFILAFIVTGFTTLQAGETGKIFGVVTDQNSGQPLVGVNIGVEGTTLGASTDEEGIFVILQLRPGRYNLQVSYIGYADVRVENVRVIVDHTARVNIRMQEKAVDLGDEIVVTAERPVIQKDVTASVQFVGAEELDQLPITDTKEGIFLQTGVLFDGLPLQGRGGKGEARYAIRGGSQDEVKWYIDGVRTASQIEGRADQGGSFTNVNLNAIEEVQVITGGFNAEYGEAQSGIINVITKEGGNQFTGSAEFIYSPSGQRHFGNYIYDPATQKEFQDNLDTTRNDGSLDPNWWSAYRQNQIYDYRDFSDQIAYLSLGGPLFAKKNTSGTFFISSQLSSEAYTFPRPRDTRDVQNILVNTAFHLGPRIKLRLSGLYNLDEHSTLQENADFTNQAKFYRGWGSLVNTTTTTFSALWTHTLSNSMYYELKLSRFHQKFIETPSDFTQLGESINPDIWGFDRYDGYPNEPFDAYAFIYDTHLENGDLSLTGSFNWQLDNNNLLKSGFEFRYNTVNEVKENRFPSFSDHPDDWLNRGLHEKYHPIQFAAYVQDKMEFEGMILNLGLRYDYFNPNRDWFAFNNLFNLSIDPDFDASLDPDGNQIDSLGREKYSFANVLAQPREPSRDYHMFSPRLGVSFPVTTNTLLHFNYGHFRQLPPLNRMFEFNYFRPEYIVKGNYNARQNGQTVRTPSNDGDPERVVFLTLEPLRPEKTIQFEVGLKHNFNNFAVLDVTAFYKDVFDQNEPRANLFDRRIYGFDPFQNRITPNAFYVTNFPGDYGDSRGFEFTLKSLFSRTFSLSLNYSFSVSTEGRATPGRINIDDEDELELIFETETTRRLLFEKVFSRPHVFRSNLYIRYPENSGPAFLGYLFKNTSASILYKYTSGPPLTYLTPENPDVEFHNLRYPAIQSVDLRVDKTLSFLGGQGLTAYLRVTNLLNTRNVRSLGDVFFDPNALTNFVETGEISSVDGFGYDISYQNYFEKRRFFFGIKYGF